MKTNKESILKCIPILFFLLTFILTFIVNLNIGYLGDDYYYIGFSENGIDAFFEKHIEHYFTTNGRLIPHILATLFLGCDMIFWKILNSLMLASIVLFGIKIISYKSNNPYSPLLSGIVLFSRHMFITYLVCKAKCILAYWFI